jgi:hypothetical protein
LIEWDSEIPSLPVLLEESAKAGAILNEQQNQSVAKGSSRHAAA